MTLKEKREKRAKAVADARAVFEKAETEKREMSAVELEQFDRFKGEADTLKGEIDKESKLEERKSWMAESARDLESRSGRVTEPEQPGRGAGGRREEETEDRSKKPFDFECRGRKYRFLPGQAEHRRCQPEYLEATRRYLTGEERNLQSDLDTAGGFLVMPELVIPEYLKTVDDQVFIRQLARKFTVTTAASLGVAKRDVKASTFVWSAELGTPTDDTALKFGKRTLTPQYSTGSIQVSRDLLRSAAMDPESIVMYELGRDAGELQEQAFLTGNGANQPLGILTASADGVSTSRDISQGNTTTSLTFDGIRAAKMKQKPQYRGKSTWMFHTDALLQIMQLKDGQGRYLWQPSTVEGQPDRLDGLPFIENLWMPNTFTTGKYVGILADFSYYWIADALYLEIQRLLETQARANKVEFICRLKLDGAPMLEEAFTRLKLA